MIQRWYKEDTRVIGEEHKGLLEVSMKEFVWKCTCEKVPLEKWYLKSRYMCKYTCRKIPVDKTMMRPVLRTSMSTSLDLSFKFIYSSKPFICFISICLFFVKTLLPTSCLVI